MVAAQRRPHDADLRVLVDGFLQRPFAASTATCGWAAPTGPVPRACARSAALVREHNEGVGMDTVGTNL